MVVGTVIQSMTSREGVYAGEGESGWLGVDEGAVEGGWLGTVEGEL